MKITTTPTKHKDSATFKVTADGVQIGYVFETRFSLKSLRTTGEWTSKK